VSKKFGEWYQKTNKTEDTNKLTLLAFKIIAILHDTLLATFIKLLETVSKAFLDIDRRTAITRSWIAATCFKCHFRHCSVTSRTGYKSRRTIKKTYSKTPATKTPSF
jgi:hypothetical protein